MTAFYIGQYDIDDEAAFADYLKETKPFIEGTAGVSSPRPAHMKCSKGSGRAASSSVEFPNKQAIKDWYNMRLRAE